MRRRLIIILIFLLAGTLVNVAVAWGILWKKDWSTVFPAQWQEGEEWHWPRDVPTHWPDMANRHLRAKGFGVRALMYHAERPPNPSWDSANRKWDQRVRELLTDLRTGERALRELLTDPKTKEERERRREEERRYYNADRERFRLSVYHAGWPMLGLGWENWGEALVHGWKGESPTFPPKATVRTEGHPPRSNWWVWGIPVQMSTSTQLIRNHRPIRPSWPGFAVNTLFYAAILWPLICGLSVIYRRIIRHRIRRRRGLCPWCAYPMGESPVCTECGSALPVGGAAVTSPDITLSEPQE
jgi:hypothetical protein